MMLKSITATLASLCLVTAASGADSTRVEVLSRTTWATPGRPEVHLLLRNPGDEAVPFSLRLGHIPGGARVSCAADLESVESDFSSRFTGWSGLSRGVVRGVIPPQGWAHRSFIIGAQGWLPPCEVPYRLDLEEGGELGARSEGTIHVGKPEWVSRGNIGSESFDWEAMVETDEVHDRRVISRLLVRNSGEEPAHLLVTARHLQCQNGERLEWALHHAAVQGEDVGPFALPPGGWAVFAAPIAVSNAAKLDRCTASIEISADTEAGLRPVETVEFPLKPTGFFGGIDGDQ
jgi:hypothetical protein